MPRHTPKRRLLAVSAALLALGTACGGSSDDEDDAATTTTTDPTEATTETTTAAEGPAEWVDVARSIEQRAFELQADPDVDRLADVYSETCTCWEARRTTIQFLADRDEHVQGEPAEVQFVRHELTDEATGLVNLTVMGETGPLQRVSSSGEVIQDFPASGQTCIAYSVRPDGPGGAWRIYSETPLPECPEEAQ